MPEYANRDDRSDQHHREKDQVIADLEHGTLKMTDGMRFLHQFRSLAKIRVHPGAINHAVNFTPADNRTGIHRIA